MVRNLIFFLVLMGILLLATVFAALNPGPIDLDVVVTRIEIQKSLALILAFGFGWLFGLLCAAIGLIRSINDRRRLRKALRLAEGEVSTLRRMPIQQTD